MATSSAQQFFLDFKAAQDKLAFAKCLITDCQPESEWLDYKQCPMVSATDRDEVVLKKLWSRSLGGFANTQGGVLVWGIDAPKELPLKVVPVINPRQFHARLLELHSRACDPPVQGVEIESHETEPGKGIVVCYVPHSKNRPHRAEWSDRQWYIRIGDDFEVAPSHFLRQLFFPETAAEYEVEMLVMHGIKKREDNLSELQFIANVRNSGNTTADNCYILLSLAPAIPIINQPPQQTGAMWVSGNGQEWIQIIDGFGRTGFVAQRSFHPGMKQRLFQSYLLVDGTKLISGQEYKTITFSLTAFSSQALPRIAELQFSVEESLLKTKGSISVRATPSDQE